MTLLSLPAKISAADAVARFNRRRWRNLFGVLALPIRIHLPGNASTRVPPFIERLWMPSYAFCFQTQLGDKNSVVWASVDASSGAFALIENIDNLLDAEIEEEFFPPKLEESAAVELARKSLLQAVLRQRGQFNKPVVGDLEQSRVYYTPYWVLYRRRRNKRIDIRVLDGHSGALTGAKTRIALLGALIAASKGMK